MKRKELLNKLIIIIPLGILIFISLLNMFIIGKTNLTYKDYFLKQTIWFILGLLILFIIYLIKPQRLFKYSKYLYFFNVLLLILVLFFGKTVNGSKAWFDLHFFSFQPSELMKFTLLLYLCEKLPHLKNDLKLILTSLFLTVIPSLFVFLEPDTGAIIIYFLITLGVIIASKIPKKWYFIFLSILTILIITFSYLYLYQKDLLIKIIGTSFFYRIDRLLTFINNDSFQLDRSLIAIGSSSFFLNHHYVYIPEAPTDFIIALSINNLGFISFIFILLSFFTLDIYFIYNYFKTQNKKKKLFYAGFLLMFIFAQIENIGMNLGLFPIIGLPLPFLSYGGTNIIVYFMFLGILLNNTKNY